MIFHARMCECACVYTHYYKGFLIHREASFVFFFWKVEMEGDIANSPIRYTDIEQVKFNHPVLWNPPSSDNPPKLQYLCMETIYKRRKILSNHLKQLPLLLREDVETFERKKEEVTIKYALICNSIQNLPWANAHEYLRRSFLCRIRLRHLYRELYTSFEKREINGVILPSPKEDNIKSLLYTAEGECASFRITVHTSKILYRKYNIGKISVTIPSDTMSNRECSLQNLPRIIEIALVDKDNNLNYNHPLCNDVKRFENCQELVNEINFLVDHDE